MIKSISLKKNNDFTRVFKHGKYASAEHIVAYVLDNGSEKNRIGITVTKKIGKSVVRNRIRRIIRENYRALEEDIKAGKDIVIVVRNAKNIPEFIDINRELGYIFRKLCLFVRE